MAIELPSEEVVQELLDNLLTEAGQILTRANDHSINAENADLFLLIEREKLIAAVERLQQRFDQKRRDQEGPHMAMIG